MTTVGEGPNTEVTLGPGGSRADADSPVLPAGTLVGRYEVRSVLGLGGMGVVYEARDPELGRTIALKLLRRDVSNDTHADLLREAQALARVTHPNVVTIHDVGTHDGSVYVAMELVDGITGTAWIARERPLAETLHVLRQAAAGLAAVHDAGLVHRDFKPGNLMIAADGRVFVMDFGLAQLVRIAEDGTPTEGDSQHDDDADSGTPFGTAAYMAPEQHRAEAALPLADQFSFAATAYEALYGVRAFASESLAGVAIDIVRGNLNAPPDDARVPAWLDRVVRRGLALRPEDRFPSMHAMLAALHPPRRRWPWMVGGVGAAALIAVGLAFADRGRDCDEAGQRIDAVWNDDARARIAAAFEATALPFQEQALASTTASLDAHARAWSDAAVSACEGSDRTAAEDLDATTHCLGERLEAMRGLVDGLREADATVVQRASAAAAKLPDIATCEDADTLRQTQRRPDDPAVAAAVDALDARMAHTHALLDAGKTADAAVAAEAIVTDARATGFAAAIVDALELHAGVRGELGETADARKSLTEAHLVATEAALDREAADLASLLVYHAAHDGDLDEAQRWRRDAQSLLARAGDPPESRALFMRSAAVLDQALGDVTSAIAHAEEAVRLYTELRGEQHPSTIRALQNLGTVLLVDRQLDAAVGPLSKAHATSARLFGELHPDTGKIAANLGALEVYRGRADDALRWFEAADAALKTIPAARALILNNRSQILDGRGEVGTALELLHEAVALLEQAHGDDHPSTWTGRSNLADALLRSGRSREALDLQLRVRDARRRLLGPDHLDTIFAEVRVASCLHAEGRNDEAFETSRAAAEIAERSLGADHPVTARALTGMGLYLIRLGRSEAAIEPLERALAIREKALGPDHREVGEAAGLLARARLDVGDLGSARRQAERAVKLLASLPEGDERRDDAARVLAATSAPSGSRPSRGRAGPT